MNKQEAAKQAYLAKLVYPINEALSAEFIKHMDNISQKMKDLSLDMETEEFFEVCLLMFVCDCIQDFIDRFDQYGFNKDVLYKDALLTFIDGLHIFIENFSSNNGVCDWDSFLDELSTKH